MYYYQNNSSGRSNNNLLKKVIIQLIAIFTIMLTLILVKYTPLSFSKIIISKVKNVFYYDASEDAQEVFEKYTPEIKKYFQNIFNQNEKNNSDQNAVTAKNENNRFDEIKKLS